VAHEKISIPIPDYATPQVAKEAGPWIPKGLKVQWSHYGEHDGSPAVGIGTGDFLPDDAGSGDPDDGGKREEMFTLWFNRSQVNHIIRALRRARKSAYGEDE